MYESDPIGFGSDSDSNLLGSDRIGFLFFLSDRIGFCRFFVGSDRTWFFSIQIKIQE